MSAWWLLLILFPGLPLYWLLYWLNPYTFLGNPERVRVRHGVTELWIDGTRYVGRLVYDGMDW